MRNRARLAAVEASLGRLQQLGGDADQPDGDRGPAAGAEPSVRRNRYAERVELLSAVEDDELPADDRREAGGSHCAGR